MNLSLRISIFFILLFTVNYIYPQTGGPISVTGDQLTGRMENGFAVREVTGNVVLTQGNVVITCDRAIQYLAANNARLIGNVVVRQNNLTIKTPEGFYYGNERRAYSERGVTLDDGKVILSARIGEYFFKENKADFRSNVVLSDSLSMMTSEELVYYRDTEFAVAQYNVVLEDSVNRIRTDSLTHDRRTQITHCFGNVQLVNRSDNTVINGDYMEDYRVRKYSMVRGNALLIQIDSVFAAGADTLLSVDTLIIKSFTMESDRDTISLFTAKDSVKILRGSFASVNDLTRYDKSAEMITTFKTSEKGEVPVLWYDNSQLTGDSVYIFLSDNAISRIDINANAFLVSKNEAYPFRFDQILGRRIRMHFAENQLSYTEIFENVLGIYYVYEDEAGNGVIKASGLNAWIGFKDKKVETVKFLGEPKSEYHPEALLAGNEKAFTLPGFLLRQGRPEKSDLLRLPGKKD